MGFALASVAQMAPGSWARRALAGRAHSLGAQRYLLDWLGYGLVVKAVARRRARLARALEQGPQAA